METTASVPTRTQDRPLPPLSQNLHKWRLRRGLSASALARDAHVSKSTVSELERGLGNPSLDTLWALARSLNVSLGALFAGAPSQGSMEIVRLEDAAVIAREGTGFVAQLLASWPGQSEVELTVVSLAKDARRNSKGNAPGVIERAVCIEGVVEVGTSAHSSVLHVGDMMMFPADQPHHYEAIGAQGRLVVVQQYADHT